MSGADLQWGESDVPIQGVNEAVDPRSLPPGQLVEAVNVTYSARDGSVAKRPGTVLAMDSLATGNANKLVVHQPKNQLLVVDLEGTDDVAPAMYGALDAPISGDTQMVARHVGNVSEVLVSRAPLFSDLSSTNISDCAYVATAGDFGYMVYASVNPLDYNAVIRVVQVPKIGTNHEPGNTVLEESVPYSRVDGNAMQVRCAPAQDRYVLVTLGLFNSGTTDFNVRGVVVDCGAAPVPTIGAPITIVNNVSNTVGLYSNDLAESTYDTDLGAGVPNWIICWITSTTVTARRLTTTALTTGWTATVGALGAVALSCYEYGGNSWLNWYDTDVAAEVPEPGWHFAVIDTVTGGTTLGRTAWCLQSDLSSTADLSAARNPTSAIVFHEDTNQVILFHSQDHDGPTSYVGFEARPTTRWRLVDTSGALSELYEKRGPWLASKPWKDANDGYYLAWCGYEHMTYHAPVGPGMPPFPSRWASTAVLMRFAEPPSAPVAFTLPGAPKAQALCATGPGYFVEPLGSMLGNPVGFTRSAQLPVSVTHGTRHSAEQDANYLGRRSTLAFSVVPTELVGGVWDVVVRRNESADFRSGYGRCQAALFGQSTYLTGGLLAQWDGDRLCENNFIAAPSVDISRIGTGGGWSADWAEQDIHFQAVWETVTSGGERVKSATSNVVTARLGGDVAMGTAPTDTITLLLEPNTVTLRTFGNYQTLKAPQTVVTVYASSEPGGDALHRLFEFSSNAWEDYISDPDMLDPITVTITDVPATDHSANELIYNDSGELDNDTPYGGCTAIAVHKDRLWVGGGDERDLLWYSKERADGRAAEFALGQQVRLPGATVVALASLDDALIAFCKEGLFAIYGDGPNATGDPASGIFQVVPISTSVGCVDPAVTVTLKGVLFSSPSGLMLLNRARGVEPVGAVNISITARPVSSSTVIQGQSHARLVMANTPALTGAGEFKADTLVYDVESGQWATWRYSLNNHSLELPAGLIADVKSLNGRVYILTDDGRVLLEDDSVGADSVYALADPDGFTYRQKLKTGWVDFGRPQGYKRVRHWLAMTQPALWADFTATPELFPYGLKASFDFNHAESGTTLTRYWTNWELGNIAAWDGITKVRCHLSKKQPSIRVTLEEEEPSRRLTATDTNASVAVAGNTTLRLKIESAGNYVNLAVADGTRTKAQIANDLNLAIQAAGWEGYVEASVGGLNQIIIQVIKRLDSTGLGSYLAVDSVANGSTLNSVIGFAAGVTVGSVTVDPVSQTGFVIQGHTFEVGQAPGPRRTAPNQSK